MNRYERNKVLTKMLTIRSLAADIVSALDRHDDWTARQMTERAENLLAEVRSSLVANLLHTG